MEHEIEFKAGDQVTYRPYEKDIAAIVDRHFIFNNEVIYVLRGNAKARTSGRCIKESKLFEEWDGK